LSLVPERSASSSRATALLCFDGSADAAAAISKAGGLLGPRHAVVLTVWEPVRVWEPWDPVTIVSGPLGRLIAKETDLDQIAAELAHDKAQHGAALARAAGFDATARVASGKAWEAICEVADALDAEPIVIGSRGLGRAGSALLGSVSAAVIAHAKRAVLVGPTHLVGSGACRVATSSRTARGD
jgi:nucleotide-binding universal stress UspA family protein